jgi:hypothetical protein
MSALRQAAAEVAAILRSDEPLAVMEGALERLEAALAVDCPVPELPPGHRCDGCDCERAAAAPPLPKNPPRPKRDLDFA